jgi:RNA polymerase sigma factor (sigma-70 family)
MNSTDQFEALVGEHYEPLFRFAMSLTRVESDAWDLTQQTFYVWAKKGHQLRDIAKAKTWLFTTLHRAFLESRRRDVKYTHEDLEEVSNELPAFNPEFADQVDSSQVLSALARVDEVYRAAVALFYLEQHSYNEIAEILAVPVGTVKSRIARGILQLRGILDGNAARDARCDSGHFAEPRLGSQPLDLSRQGVPEARHPRRPGRAGLAAGQAACMSGWDISSTPLREPIGAAGIVKPSTVTSGRGINSQSKHEHDEKDQSGFNHTVSPRPGHDGPREQPGAVGAAALAA